MCVSPSHACRIRAPLVLRRGASAQPWICLASVIARTSSRHVVLLVTVVSLCSFDSFVG